MDNHTISFRRRSLPHWEVYGKSYFVTFRLSGSLPSKVVLELKSKREALKQDNAKDHEILQFQRQEFKKIENVLNSVRNDENAFLARNDIAPILMNAFFFLESKYCWRFPSFVIMPNHVHCLCLPDKDGVKVDLTAIFGLFKRFTAKKINAVLERKGRVWSDENFDHWCRNPEKENAVKRYIANNPVKARLVAKTEDWQWQK